MRKTQTDLAAPGCCIICRQTRVHGEDFLVETGALNDFGVQTPLTGQVMICNVCIEELAETHGGFVKKSEVEVAQANYEQTRVELREFAELTDELGARAVAVQNAAVRLDERLASRESEGSA